MTRKIPLKALLPFFSGLLLLLAFSAAADRRKKAPPKVISIYDIDTLKAPIPLRRQKVHDDIAKQLNGADATDGSRDHFIWVGDDTLSSNVLTQAILHDAAHLDTMIENLPFTDVQTEHQTKLRYLKAVYNLLVRFNHDTKADPYFYKKLVANERALIIARHENKVLEFAQANANIYTLNNAELLEGYPEARSIVYSAVGRDNPKMMIRRLPEFANEPFADSIIIAAARVVPNEIYNYASSTNYTISNAIRRTSDPLVQAIVRITKKSQSPLKAMSFLNDIYTGKKTVAEIDKITADPDLYYKNLVRLKVEGQTLGGETYTQDLQLRGLRYVRTMNDLHEESNPAVRFRCIDGLAPEELYFLMVYGQDEIYTSTFLGTYNRMMERLKPKTGDQLLETVKYDHFRTFLRMCAGYSVLDGYLATMPADKKTALMKDFIANLEKGKEDDLEDAVDVADAYGSIEDSLLRGFLKEEVLNNYKRVSELKSTKGVIVYGLLSTIFKGGSPTDLSPQLGLPDINLVPYKSLAGDTGVVFEQCFFYGDDDGKSSFSSFMGLFKDGKWKVTAPNRNWTQISSTAGKPIVIYASMPVEGEGEDEKAQAAMVRYMDSLNIKPTFIVHRGHSYHLTGTIEQMQKQNRIVMLGSCGGYHNLGAVLDHAPDGQIISTKQVGSMRINEPIIREINSHISAGEDVDWVTCWHNLDVYFKKQPAEVYAMFKEYVPPHRNLGAIFIKAYRRILTSQES